MSSYLTCSLNHYFLRSHGVWNLMLGTAVAEANQGPV